MVPLEGDWLLETWSDVAHCREQSFTLGARQTQVPLVDVVDDCASAAEEKGVNACYLIHDDTPLSGHARMQR
jgi:hypothetical protein